MRRQCSSTQMQKLTHMATRLLHKWLWRWHLLLLLLSPWGPHSDVRHHGHRAIGGLEAGAVHPQLHLCSTRVQSSVQILFCPSEQQKDLPCRHEGRSTEPCNQLHRGAALIWEQHEGAFPK